MGDKEPGANEVRYVPLTCAERSFALLCDFWVIVHDILAVYRSSQGTSNMDHVPLGFVESKYQQLLAWMSRPRMGREQAVPANVIFFQ